MNNKLQELQIDLMNDSKLETEQFIEKYCERIREILEDKITEDLQIKAMYKEIYASYFCNENDPLAKIENWQKWKIMEGVLWGYIFKKLKNGGYNSSN